MEDIDRQALRDLMAEKVMGWLLSIPSDIFGQHYWDDQKKLMRHEDWKPDLDSNQLDILIDKMVGDGFQFRIDIYINHNTVSCWNRKPELNLVEERHTDLRLAVLLAIKAAKNAIPSQDE